MSASARASGSESAPKPPSRVSAAQRRRVNLRRDLWPDVEDGHLWDRKSFVGFTTIPRTLSLILTIIDSLDRKTAGRVYFDLWCRAFDDYMVEIRDEYEAALSSGYQGQRAIRTWRERVDVLERFGFVRTNRTPHGSYRYILVLEPHRVVRALERNGQISEEIAFAFRAQMLSIGAARR